MAHTQEVIGALEGVLTTDAEAEAAARVPLNVDSATERVHGDQAGAGAGKRRQRRCFGFTRWVKDKIVHTHIF